MRVLVRTTENETLEEMRERQFDEITGRPIQYVPIDESLWLACNDEGKCNGLPPTGAWIEGGELLDIICGNHIIFKMDANYRIRSLSEKDVRRAKGIIRYLKRL